MGTRVHTDVHVRRSSVIPERLQADLDPSGLPWAVTKQVLPALGLHVHRFLLGVPMPVNLFGLQRRMNVTNRDPLRSEGAALNVR